jgi:Cupin superfamily protein
MTDYSELGRLELAPQVLDRSFNREPIGFDHNLSTLGMFELDSLRTLAEKYAGHDTDYMVASSASAPDQKFRSVKTTNLTPSQAIERLKTESVRILLKRPQDYDSRFQKLLDGLTEQVVSLSGELRADRIVRLESSIFLTSARTLTPFHFDPSAVFFFQIAGDKIYHVYPPAALTEPELEQFYFRGLVDIAQVELSRRDPKLEHVFNLVAGKGLHQPQNAPHWVETNGDISISYSFFFETMSARKINRTRGFNYYMRKAGAEPTLPGARPRLDAFKADAMGVWIPCRKTLSAVKSAALGK